MGLKVLAFTFDNGFISRAAFDNIRRQTSRLGVPSVIERTERMNDIFVESLNSDQTVCSGCFKALTTLSTRLAQQRNTNVVVSGLSRGQIFDTKLLGQFREGVREVQEMEKNLQTFREIFHASDDRTARLLNDDLHDIPLHELHFVDFFRYDDTPVSEIREFLGQRDAWWRQPADTGFCSSNCLMNDVGICVHSQQRGYHNYEAPLSWDVRLGISTRDQVLPEVEETVDGQRTQSILQQIGFFDRKIQDVRVLDNESTSGHRQLTAYYTANQTISASELRGWLARSLPQYMIPAHFVQVEKMPLTINGKIDTAALRKTHVGAPAPEAASSPPETEVELLLAEIWKNVLGTAGAGRHDNFFEVGGDSLQAMSLVTSVNDAFQIELTVSMVFEAGTLANLSSLLEEVLLADIDAAGHALPPIHVESGPDE
jgi:acyl carrier protein